MYTGDYRNLIGFYILIACVLVAILVAITLIFWDAEVIFAWVYQRMVWVYWRMVETGEILGEFWKELGK